MTTQTTLAVARRYFLAKVAKALPMGARIEVGDVRIHRYRDHFKVWDLTAAGKRGKKVRVMTIMPSSYFEGDPDEWMDRMSKAIPEYDSYDGIKRFIADVLIDYPKEILLNESSERGIDVLPGGEGSQKIVIKTNTGLLIEAAPHEFRLLKRWEIKKDDKPSGMFQDTNYYPAGKRDAQAFYAWLRVNQAEAKGMDLEDYRKLWKDLEVRYDYH